MKTGKTSLFFFIAVILFSVLFTACKKDKDAEGIDKELFDMAKNTNGFTWYKFSDDLLNKSAGSGHDYPYLRTRFNAVAAQMLDSTGKIQEGISFPEGSLIVKELYSDASSLSRYAILYKKSHPSADANGWLWGYVNSDETVAITAEDKGKQCIGCHNQAGNIDYMLMNVYFP